MSVNTFRYENNIEMKKSNYLHSVFLHFNDFSESSVSKIKLIL